VEGSNVTFQPVGALAESVMLSAAEAPLLETMIGTELCCPATARA
jgi:hypothetical protein